MNPFDQAASRAHRKRQIAAADRDQPVAVLPVSYTHLDVYKRQIHNRPPVMLVIERTQHLLRLVHDLIDFIFTRDGFAVNFDQSSFARFHTQLRYDLSVDLDASLQLSLIHI